MNLFGYGTFITNKMYLDKHNIKPAYLPNYIRIVRPFDQFPFILKQELKKNNMNVGFWGLKFEIRDSDLEIFDYYEGEGELYERINVKCVYSDCSEEKISVYYPTQKTIEIYHLRKYISSVDNWRIKIMKKHPDIISAFPDLMRTDDPRNF